MTRISLLMIGLALAACSKAQPPGPAPEPRRESPPEAAPEARKEPIAAPAPAPPPAPATAGASAKKGPRMSPDDEAVIAKHYEKQGWGKPVEILTYERVPGMYKAVFSDGADYGVVRAGKRLDGKGLGPAGAYMKDAKLLATGPDAHELTTLLSIFEALPPVSGYASPDQFYDHDTKHKQLNPKADLGPGGGKLVLHYLVPHKGGAVPQPNLVPVKRWTLAIPADYKLAWREEETKLDTSGP